MLRIKHLKARAFRGIGRELNLPLNGKSLVLYGDSGTGKSSVAEVIEHALTGRVESLDGRGQQVSFVRHGTHVRMRREDTLAQVTITDGRSDYVLAEGRSRGQSEGVDAFLRAARQGTFILRRGILLNFIENMPSKRYDALRPFLGLREFEVFEQALKEAAEGEEQKSARTAAKARSVENSFRIAVGLPEGANLEEAAVLKHLSEAMATIGQPPVKSEDDVKSRAEAIGKLLEGYSDISLYQKTHDCRTRISDFLGTIPKREDVEKTIEKEGDLRQLEKELAGVFYEEVLTFGQKWIEEERRKSCPLCEQPIPDLDALCRRIQVRIDENAKVIAARSELRRLVPALRTGLRLAAENGERALRQWEDAGLLKEDWPFGDVLGILTALSTAVGVGDRVSDTDAAQQACLRLAPEKIGPVKKKGEEALEKKEGKLPEKRKVEKLIRAKARCQAFLDQFEEVCQQGKQVSRGSAVANQMRKLHQLAVEARKRASQEAFESISDELERIYGQFHPGEDVGDLQIDVREYGEGGAYLVGRFADRRDEDPRGLFSEAHLDTLGLAVFLALRKRDAALNPAFRVVVLDDVLSSVDAPHRRRVAGYLLSEFTDEFQLIITTHNRLWFEWLCQLQRARGLTDSFVNRRILSWNLDSGPELVQMQQDYDFVRSQKDILAPEVVVLVAGRLLEHALQTLRYSLRLAVPARRDERYTISPLWDSFRSTAKKRYGPLWARIEGTCEKLNDTVVIRNWGTHSNEWSRSLSRDEGMEFIDAVLSLFERVYCEKCGSFVRVCEAPQRGVSCKKGCLAYFPTVSAPDAASDPS